MILNETTSTIHNTHVGTWWRLLDRRWPYNRLFEQRKQNRKQEFKLCQQSLCSIGDAEKTNPQQNRMQNNIIFFNTERQPSSLAKGQYLCRTGVLSRPLYYIIISQKTYKIHSAIVHCVDGTYLFSCLPLPLLLIISYTYT